MSNDDKLLGGLMALCISACLLGPMLIAQSAPSSDPHRVLIIESIAFALLLVGIILVTLGRKR